MKILIITDKKDSAIDILCRFIERHNPQHQIDVVPFHPKRPDEVTLKFVTDHINNYDIVHFAYWKSWQKVKEYIKDLKGKFILDHHNPYDLDKEDWQKHFDAVVCKNEYQRQQLGYGEVIRQAVDEDIWEWKEELPDTVGMCANRIEGKKGILEAAQAAKELDKEFILIGRISDQDYFDKIMELDNVYPMIDLPFERMLDAYHKIGTFVINSVENFESGPMPAFEAALCGRPVTSTEVGNVMELMHHDKNILIHENKEQLKENILILNDKKIANRIRNEAWKVAKGMTSLRYAYQYNQLYHDVLYNYQPLVSVIVPTVPDRVDNVDKIRKSLEEQSYENTELIAINDNEEGYNLAKSRNKGIVQARGEYLLFLDDRLILEDKDSIKKFITQHGGRKNVFLWGDKGAGERNFVENFSFTSRHDLIKAGMFNERINVYGAMSQEIRERLRSQGWVFDYCEGAKAKELQTSHNRNRKGDIIKAKDFLFTLGL